MDVFAFKFCNVRTQPHTRITVQSFHPSEGRYACPRKQNRVLMLTESFLGHIRSDTSQACHRRCQSTAWKTTQKLICAIAGSSWKMGKSKLLSQGDVNSSQPCLETIFITKSFQFSSDIKKNIQFIPCSKEQASKSAQPSVLRVVHFPVEVTFI